MLRNYIHMGKADLLHHSSGRNVAGAVEGSIYNGDLVLHLINGLLVYYLGLYLRNVFVVNLFSDNLISA